MNVPANVLTVKSTENGKAAEMTFHVGGELHQPQGRSHYHRR